MEEKETIVIENQSGESFEAELVTYLISKDKKNVYIVYTNDEVEENGDQVIYVSKIVTKNNSIKVEEIVDDSEWLEVQELLKEIANK